METVFVTNIYLFVTETIDFGSFTNIAIYKHRIIEKLWIFLMNVSKCNTPNSLERRVYMPPGFYLSSKLQLKDDSVGDCLLRLLP